MSAIFLFFTVTEVVCVSFNRIQGNVSRTCLDRILRRSCGEEDVWFANVGMASLLFADDTVLPASSVCECA